MLGHSKIASLIHAVGAVGTLITYYNYMLLFADVADNNGPSALYMPCLFLTIITIIIMLLINIPKWLDKRYQKEHEVAPSIISDDEED
jgi:Na+/melibiose symporter-like transporter